MCAELIKLFELLAFAVSAAAFGCGAVFLFRRRIPQYFKLHVCAAGCYMLEELWVIINSLLGTGSQDGLVTVRLFGFFGCLCFMLSANMKEFAPAEGGSKGRGTGLLSLAAPAALLAVYATYAHSPLNAEPAAAVIVGLLSISPALFASRLSLRHLLTQADASGQLKAVRGTDLLALVFYAVNYLYPLTDLYWTKTVMSIYDCALAVILLFIILACMKGAAKWKTKI